MRTPTRREEESGVSRSRDVTHRKPSKMTATAARPREAFPRERVREIA